nr:TetR/AcrR family transcriptional regulator [Nocardioides daedukensis]
MRERLLTVAFEQFGERGYQDTTMASIGAAADVTGPNVYGYFASKSELLRAVTDRGTHALWLNLDRTLASAATPADALHELVRSYTSLMGSWASTLEDPSGEHDVIDTMRAGQREYIAEWVALLQAVVPGLDQQQARARCQLAMFLISDLHKTRHIVRHANFHENLVAMVLAVLLDRSVPGS